MLENFFLQFHSQNFTDFMLVLSLVCRCIGKHIYQRKLLVSGNSVIFLYRLVKLYHWFTFLFNFYLNLKVIGMSAYHWSYFERRRGNCCYKRSFKFEIFNCLRKIKNIFNNNLITPWLYEPSFVAFILASGEFLQVEMRSEEGSQLLLLTKNLDAINAYTSEVEG